MVAQLNVYKCESCGGINYNPYYSCRLCGEQAFKKLEMPNNGILYTFTKIHIPPEGWGFEVPYVVGVVSIPVGDGQLLLTALYNGDTLPEIGVDVLVDVFDEKIYFQLVQ